MEFYMPKITNTAILCLDSGPGCFLSCSAWAQEDSIKEIHFKNASKEYHYGIPFLYLQGTDYEAGLQYGNLLKVELNAMHEDFEKFKEQMMENEICYLPWYKRIIANLFGEWYGNTK